MQTSSTTTTATHKQIKAMYRMLSEYPDLLEVTFENKDISLDALTRDQVALVFKAYNARHPATLHQRECILHIQKYQNDMTTLLSTALKSINVSMLTKSQAQAVINILHRRNKEYIPVYLDLSNFKYHFIQQEKDYYIAFQVNTKKMTSTKIIAFRDLLVIDFDHKTLDDFIATLRHSNETFMIYETFNGFHAYCVSKRFPHWHRDTLQFMSDLLCDTWYVHFSKRCGFAVRLSKKPRRQEHFVEKYVCTVGTAAVDSTLLDLVKYKDSLLWCRNSLLCESLV
jgi:hypothetical protein